jgi:UDP-N-acetylmuramate--alanine ligase
MTQDPRVSGEVLPSPPARVHFIGVGGISMSGFAILLHERGYAVTGSDSTESATVASLRDRGIPVVIGHDDPSFAAQADVVVSTLRAEMHATIELEAAREGGARLLSRGQLLGMIANPRRQIAVAGTHGKSTTSGMLAVGLVGLEQDPGFAVGALLPGINENTAAGTGEFMVVEADEFSRSFLWLQPEVAIVTSVSFDHPDIYADQQAYDDAFLAFVRGIRPGGMLVVAHDEPGCQRLLAKVLNDLDRPFGVTTFGLGDESDWQVLDGPDGWVFRAPDGLTYPASLGVPGLHNARNAIAAVAALHAVGFTPREAIDAIEPFTGVGRRFEHKGTMRGIDVVDDYAHHPEEISATIHAARRRFPGRRILAVHQPHTYSRTLALIDGFVAALNLADEVVLLDIYPSGEDDNLGVSSADILRQLTVPAHAASDPVTAGTVAASAAREGDVVLTLGAGDITRTGAVILERLAETGAASAAPVRPQRVSRKAADTFTIPAAPHLKATRNASMAMFTTMRLGGPADVLVRTPTPEDIEAVAAWAKQEGMPVTVIGGGSNLLVSDAGIRGVVIVARTPGERAEHLVTVEDRDDRVRVTVSAQAPLSWVGRYCAEHGWAGMDWGVGLPGQIGGATVNNAGAHGTELKDHLVAIDLLMSDGSIEQVPAAWLAARYRMTRIKEAVRPREWTVLRSVFELPRADPTGLVALADDHAAFRKRTQPTGACSGSTFANPPGDYAGRLLEAAGLKGFTLGAMQFSPKHANWVMNTGGGTAHDAWSLIQHAREVVNARFGVVLHPEIERVGAWDPS